jgi:2'-5' RNA ligase
MHRLFVAIRPPEEVRDVLIDAMDDGMPLRWRSDDQLHLTLRFIAEVERPMAEDLAAELERVRFGRFSIALAGIGRFDAHRRGVLWAGIHPKDELKGLAAKVEGTCLRIGLEPERRKFHPHITLALWKGSAPMLDAFMERHGGLKSQPWAVDRFILYESRLHRDAAHYEKVADYPLA